VSNAIDIVRSTLKLPAIVEAKRARQMFRAVPVATTTPDGRLQATVDLLYATDKGWHLVNFKTEKQPRPDALKKYAEQIGGCAVALSTILQQPVASSVCLVRSGEMIEAASL
jgi:ATP-dependent exoDNAse (exonuclease V) beta subunit